MTDDKHKALVPRTAGELQRIDKGSLRLLSRVTADAQVFARTMVPQVDRFRIGEFEFREPDYNQIHTWAECLDLTPNEILRRLQESSYERSDGSVVRFLVVDGAIRTLVLDTDRFVWPDGRLNSLTLPELNKLYFSGSHLTELECDARKLTELDLSTVPQLSELWCERNKLSVLDLSMVPELTHLNCNNNQLIALDLMTVPKLKELRCYHNHLREIDLSAVPALTALYCGCNDLTELDLSTVPMLTELYCHVNELSQLDLSTVPDLRVLNCEANSITRIDVTTNRKLATLIADPWVVEIDESDRGLLDA
jgi:Leucine-rich repeat (LRR) protein